MQIKRICMKYQILSSGKKKRINLSSAKFVLRVIEVNELCVMIEDMLALWLLWRKKKKYDIFMYENSEDTD